MIIRELNHSDMDQVKKIARLAWKDTYSTFIPEEIQSKVLKEAYSVETMDKRSQTSFMMVAEIDEVVRGYAFFSHGSTKQEIFLESIYVQPSYQGTGIGMHLLQAGIENYSNPESISLTVYKGNLNISFYEKEGFKKVKETVGDFCGHPVTFIQMRKNFPKCDHETRTAQ